MLKGPDVPPVTVTKLTSYLPLNDQPIQYSSGSYFLYGQTNIYGESNE